MDFHRLSTNLVTVAALVAMAFSRSFALWLLPPVFLSPSYTNMTGTFSAESRPYESRNALYSPSILISFSLVDLPPSFSLIYEMG